MDIVWRSIISFIVIISIKFHSFKWQFVGILKCQLFAQSVVHDKFYVPGNKKCEYDYDDSGDDDDVI